MTSLPPFLAPERTRFLPIPDELTDAFFPAKLCLFEWTDYWFQWRGATHLRVGEQWIEPFAPHLFRVRWENTLGATQIQPFDAEKPLDEPLFAEILSPKFPTPNAHLQFFRALLSDLFRCAALLPFDFAGETSRGIETSQIAPSALWTQLFLKQNGARLGAAFRHFLSRPNDQFTTEALWQNVRDATRFDGDVLVQTVRGDAVWTRQNARFVPSQVVQNRAVLEIDTPENRFVAAFARRLMTCIEPTQWDDVFGWCAQIDARFPRWSDEIILSSALERKSTTRELVSLWRLWNGAGAPLFAPFERAAKLRDVASLYEFWVFFALVAQLQSDLAQTPRLEVVADEKRGLNPLSRAHFKDGTLVFNGPAPSYSTALRPDFLWLENGAPTLAFDAKFRLETGETEAQSRGRGADLHKMHAYRDALGVRSALAIHPGAHSIFFDRERGPLQHFSLRALLEGTLNGVGTRGLRPSE
jgi:hypothetical protein